MENKKEENDIENKTDDIVILGLIKLKDGKTIHLDINDDIIEPYDLIMLLSKAVSTYLEKGDIE